MSIGYFVFMARSYRQKSCPVARSLDIIGERWTILLLRDLFLHDCVGAGWATCPDGLESGLLEYLDRSTQAQPDDARQHDDSRSRGPHMLRETPLEHFDLAGDVEVVHAAHDARLEHRRARRRKRAGGEEHRGDTF